MNNNKNHKDWSKTKEYKELRQDMLDDLEMRGLIGVKFVAKVNEYMKLWCIYQMLTDDIEERGVYVEYTNGATQKGTTENKSLTGAIKASSQMLNIWTALGFKEQAVKAVVAPSGGDEDDEL